jgi:gamma-glutamyltranspeptidase/glutathione hydrolase
MVVSPHHLASQAGLDILKDGGDAVEAAVAVAACLAVVYPHMTGIGGDGFWLIAESDGSTRAIDACGRSAMRAQLPLYAGFTAIPWRGPLAANTVAGTISGWAAALETGSGHLPLARLLRDAIHYADAGTFVTNSWEAAAVTAGVRGQPGVYADIYEPQGRPLREGDRVVQRALASTLRQLADDGLESFYRGRLAETIAADLATLGSPLTVEDFHEHAAKRMRPDPLSISLDGVRLFNTAPPTQGLASLLILAMFDRLGIAHLNRESSFAHVHGLVEATKQAFLIRDAQVGDPAWMTLDPQALLDDDAALDAMTASIDLGRALPWPQPPSAGDTTWFAAIDANGRAASVIQSLYFEFGSGVVLPDTGIVWQNRGASFRLAEDGWNALQPRRKPFHTLNPALARFDDGRVMAYGTMGGEGQPQTQAAVFTRYARFGMPLQQAVSAPRWLLGRAWGEQSTTLKLENRFNPALYAELRAAGHEIELVAPFDIRMGHAGAIVRHADGALEGATDPRSDGGVAAW